MIPIIISSLLLGILFIYTCSKHENGDARWYHYVFSIMATIMVITSITVCVLQGIIVPQYLIDKTECIEIACIEDNTIIEGKISGGLFVINGYINDKPAFFFYREENGGYIQEYIYASQAIIYEDAQLNTGHIIKNSPYYVRDAGWIDSHLHWVIIAPTNQSPEPSYEIHVPQGTIIRTFVLDAE